MLNMDSLPAYRFSSFRHFEKGEKHMYRVFREDVLLLVMDGVLRFHEDGVPVEVGRGEFYIQKHGLEQDGVEPERCSALFFYSFRRRFQPLQTCASDPRKSGSCRAFSSDATA